MQTAAKEADPRSDEPAGPEDPSDPERGNPPPDAARRVCPRCQGALEPTLDQPRSKPDYWVRIDPTGAWVVGRDGPTSEETPMLVLYGCHTCQLMFQLVAPKMRR